MPRVSRRRLTALTARSMVLLNFNDDLRHMRKVGSVIWVAACCGLTSLTGSIQWSEEAVTCLECLARASEE